MSQLAVTTIMAGSALLALGLLIPSLKRARTAGDLDSSTALTLGMGWLISLPVVLAVISGDLVRRPDVFGELVLILPGWYLGATRFAMVLAAALAVLLALRQVTSARVPVHVAALFAVLLWTIAHLASGLHGERLISLAGVVLLVCLMAATVLPGGRGACLGAGIFGVTLAITSGALAVFRYDDVFVPCREQCTVLGASLTGALPNENLLAVALTAAIPFAYLGFRGAARYWFIFYLAAMAIATTSRTAIVASVLIVTALLIVRPHIDAARVTFGRAAVAGVLLVGALFASVYVTQHDWNPSELTDRPHLWEVATAYLHESPAFGYGPEKWTELYRSSEIPRAAQRSAHNQWMDVLFVAGWVGAALFVSMLAAVLWWSGHARPGVMVALATILMIGTTEGMWAIGTLDWVSFSLVALILAGSPKETVTSDTGAGARASSRSFMPALSPSRFAHTGERA